MRVGITREFHHVEAPKRAGGRALITKYRLPGAAFGAAGVGRFSTLDILETVEISLYLIGVSAVARARDERGARLCAEAMGTEAMGTEAMGTEAVHRALMRFARGLLGLLATTCRSDAAGLMAKRPLNAPAVNDPRSVGSFTAARWHWPARRKW